MGTWCACSTSALVPGPSVAPVMVVRSEDAGVERSYWVHWLPAVGNLRARAAAGRDERHAPRRGAAQSGAASAAEQSSLGRTPGVWAQCAGRREGGCSPQCSFSPKWRSSGEQGGTSSVCTTAGRRQPAAAMTEAARTRRVLAGYRCRTRRTMLLATRPGCEGLDA